MEVLTPTLSFFNNKLMWLTRSLLRFEAGRLAPHLFLLAPMSVWLSSASYTSLPCS